MQTAVYSILIVEDDLSIQKLLALWCLRLGHAVVCASDGHEAISKLDEFVPTYIITDLSMPDMDGFALIKHLRSDNRFARTRIVILTGLDKASVDAINPFTVSAILQKPLKFSQLRTALHG